MDVLTVIYIITGLIYMVIPSVYLATALASFTTQKRNEEEGELPSVTVLVPTFNDGEHVKRVIRGLEETDYPEDRLEIIFIDDSDDDTSKIIDDFASHRKNVYVLRRGRRLGKPSALNHGLAIAKGEVIVVYDADSAPRPYTLRKLVSSLRGEVVATQGGYEVDVRNTLNKMIDLEYTLWQGGQLVAVPVIVGYNYAVRKSYLERIGGWDEEALAEDHILWYKIYSDGGKIRYVEDAKVSVLEPLTFKELVKQRVRWSKGSVQATEKARKAGGKLMPEPRSLNLLLFTARYTAPSQTAISLIALTLTLTAIFAFPYLTQQLFPLLYILLASILTTCAAGLLFCIRMGKAKLWIYFIPLSFIVLYQNILFPLVRRKRVAWEKVQK